MNDAKISAASVEAMAQLFAQRVPHGRDIRISIDEPAPDGRTRMRIAPQPFLAADPAATFFFPGVMFSLADSASGFAVFRALRRFVPIATLDMRIDHLSLATMNADLVAVADCYEITDSIAFVRCELLSGPQQKMTAFVMGTFMLSSASTKIDDYSASS
jgi:acyl-coenzyme A thioesterase PaaI-like protein